MNWPEAFVLVAGMVCLACLFLHIIKRF
jgi:hypothetical protein